jgi:hypothetical protein
MRTFGPWQDIGFIREQPGKTEPRPAEPVLPRGGVRGARLAQHGRARCRLLGTLAPGMCFASFLLSTGGK